MEKFARGFLAGGTLFDELGFYYVGPIDGHNLEHLLPVLQNVRDAKNGPILVHVVTQKGKGYAPAEAASDKYHGVVKFDVATGAQAKAKANAPSYTKVFGESLVKEAQKDDRVVAITAAMPSGTGVDIFEKSFPKRTFDVGIAEQHAVTFAAGFRRRRLQALRRYLWHRRSASSIPSTPRRRGRSRHADRRDDGRRDPRARVEQRREEHRVHRVQRRARQGFFAEVDKAAKLRNIPMVASERFAPKDTSVTGQVLKVISVNPDAIVIGASGTPAAMPASALRERGYKGKIYFNHGVANNDFLRVGGKDVEGAFVPASPVIVAYQLPDNHPAKKHAEGYTKLYKASYGLGSVAAFGSFAWDACLELVEAIPGR